MVLESEMRREYEEDRDQSPTDNTNSSHNHNDSQRTDGSTGPENIRYLKMRLPKMIQERRNLGDTSFRSETSENNNDGRSTGEKSSSGGAPFLSPSGEESISSSSSFPDRRKKKPKFQVMLEKAREEESRLRAEKNKPLFMRIQEKSLAESDRDEIEKIEMSKRERSMPKKKKISISRDVSPASVDSKKKIVPVSTNKQRNNGGNVPGKLVKYTDPELSSSDVENHYDNHSRITKKQNKKSNSKQPLFQRLAAQAKMEAEREAKDKVCVINTAILLSSTPLSLYPSTTSHGCMPMVVLLIFSYSTHLSFFVFLVHSYQTLQLDKYNMIRLQKQAAKAPTR